MRKLMISVSVLGIMALPALAQEHGYGHHFDKALQAKQAQDAKRAQPPAAPTAAPQQGRDHGGNRGSAAPRMSPQATPQATPRAAPQATPQANRGSNRGNDNRAGDRNRQGNSDRFGSGGQRNNYSSFRNYHQSFNAQRRFHAPSYRRPHGWYDRRWSFGDFLPSLFWSQQYWLSNYYAYDLPPPPYGTVWVRNGNDALLIDRDSGEIITVEYGVFY
jgi:Ni/Co efflux regulator RcnB